MLYVARLFCPCHTDAVQLFDDDKHKPYTGTCGHTICKECFETTTPTDCQFCHTKDAFYGIKPNYAAIALIEQCRQNFWTLLKKWWNGENFDESLCSNCSEESRILRICLLCDGDELCISTDHRIRMKMKSAEDLVHLSRHVLCADCALDNHSSRGHEIAKIDEIYYSRKDIKMTTASIILELFRDGMTNMIESIECKSEQSRIEYNRNHLSKLLQQCNYKEKGECGYLGELIKMELIDKYIADIDRVMGKMVTAKNDTGTCTVCHKDFWNSILNSTPTRKRLEIFTTLNENLPEQWKPESNIQCRICAHREFYIEKQEQMSFCDHNWLAIMEKYLNAEMFPLETLCLVCLSSLNLTNVGVSCEELALIDRSHRTRKISYKSKAVEQIFLTCFLRRVKRKCAKMCLMKDSKCWKYEINGFLQGTIDMIVKGGIENSFGAVSCELQIVKMYALATEFSNILSDPGVRDCRLFHAKILQADRIINILKNQLKVYCNGTAFEKPGTICKCTMLSKKCYWILLEKPTDITRSEREKIENFLKALSAMAECTLMEEFSGCPMDSNHKIVLDEKLMKEIEEFVI